MRKCRVKILATQSCSPDSSSFSHEIDLIKNLPGGKFRDTYSNAIIYLVSRYLKEGGAVQAQETVICSAKLPNIDAITYLINLYLSGLPMSSQVFPEATVTSASTTANRMLGAKGGNLTLTTDDSYADIMYIAAREVERSGEICHLFIGDICRSSLYKGKNLGIVHIVLGPTEEGGLEFSTTNQTCDSERKEISDNGLLTRLLRANSGHFRHVWRF